MVVEGIGVNWIGFRYISQEREITARAFVRDGGPLTISDMARVAAFLCLLASVASFTVPGADTSRMPTRREIVASTILGPSIFFTASRAEAYGFAARPARDFSGVAMSERVPDETDLRIAAAKEAAAAKATTGKFGSEPQATPTTPAQQKIAKAKADAMAKAQKR